MGHVRLSIIDPSAAGHQPMTDSTGRYLISYNGEIYNFVELRSYLDDAYGPIPWRSATDTEVILEGFAREGNRFLSGLNGIFSFAIYDSQEQLLHVLRDPIGVKPLFLTEQAGGVFLCSELKGLIGFPCLRSTLRMQSLADQLAFMYVPEPHTIFEEFRKITPGVCITYSRGKEVSSARLFDHLCEPVTFVSQREAVECFQSTFSAAVKRQLVSDVPVSLFLSGGVDSSAVAYEAVRNGANIKDAYTIAVSGEDRRYDRQSDDLHYAQIIADDLGLNLQIVPAKRQLVDLLPRLSRFMEDGFSDPAAINTYIICAGARARGVKVMLSGQGADEYLGGYRRYLAGNILDSMPTALRRVLSSLGNLVPAAMPGKANAIARRLKRITSLAGLDRRERLLRFYTWNSSERIVHLFAEPDGITIGHDLNALFDKFSDSDTAAAMMLVDHAHDLRSLNLTYTDRMSMAVGVEARVPFLDLELVKVMNAIPSRWKIRRGVSKYILKKAMAPHLPHEIVHREKAGFGLPIRAWSGYCSALFERYFERTRIVNQGIFDASAVQRMRDEHAAGRGDHSNTLLSMLCIQIGLDSLTPEVR